MNKEQVRGVRILLVPYDRGPKGEGMGEGPIYLLEHGLVAELRRRHSSLRIEAKEVRPRGRERSGWDGAVAINLGLKDEVGRARDDGLLPLVIGGGCLVSLGAVAGLGSTEDLGILWFDAHGDLNTPETSPSGCIEGMPLALLLGLFGHPIWRKLSGQPALSVDRVILAAARDLDPGEQSFIDSARLPFIGPDSLASEEREEEVLSLARDWAGRCRKCYLHIDVDSIAAADVPAVMFPSPGGVQLARMQELVGNLLPLPPVHCVSVTALYPDADRSERSARSVISLIDILVGRIARQRP